MSTGPDSLVQEQLPLFGSPHRVGREDSAYQLDRLRRLSLFALRLAAAHERQMQFAWRQVYSVGRESTRIHDELVKTIRGWEEQRLVLQSQQMYIRELEQERDRLWAEVQRVGRAWAEQQGVVTLLQSRVAELDDRCRLLQSQSDSLSGKPNGKEATA